MATFDTNTTPDIPIQSVSDVAAELAAIIVKEETNHLTLDPAPTGVPTTEGTLSWNDQDHTLNIQTEVSGVTQQVGQEQFVRCRNNSGTTISNGKVVYLSGSSGQRPTIALASRSTDAHVESTIGIATHDIDNNSDGYVTTMGLVRGIVTTGLTEGAPIYLDTTVGSFTETRPTSGHVVRVGWVVVAGNNGTILVHTERLSTTNAFVTAAIAEDPAVARQSIGPINSDGNGIQPLDIPTHDGNPSLTHPSVIYVPGGWNGYTYWMAHTPWPGGGREQPNVVCSMDGENWVVPEGLTNPIFTNHALYEGSFQADTEICLLPNGKMAVFCSVINEGNGCVRIIRHVSDDGVTWTHQQVAGPALGSTTPDVGLTSISVIVEEDGTTMRMFGVGSTGSPGGLTMRTSTDNGATWVSPTDVALPESYFLEPWHACVRKARGEYHVIVTSKDTNSSKFKGRLFYAKTEGGDPTEFFGDVSYPCIPIIGEWDSGYHYRTTMVPRSGNGPLAWDVWVAGAVPGYANTDESSLTNPWRVGLLRNFVLDPFDRPMSRGEVIRLLERTEVFPLLTTHWKNTKTNGGNLENKGIYLHLTTSTTTGSSVFVVPTVDTWEDNLLAPPGYTQSDGGTVFKHRDRWRICFSVRWAAFNDPDVSLIVRTDSQGAATTCGTPSSAMKGAYLKIKRDGGDVYTADGTTLNTYASAIPAQLPNRTSKVVLDVSAGNLTLEINDVKIGTFAGMPHNFDVGAAREPAFELRNNTGTYAARVIFGKIQAMRVYDPRLVDHR